MSSRKIKRITSEIKELENSVNILEQSGIYFYYDESNISILYAMIIGPKDTPYENGFYFFKFEYPDNYPMQPPIAKYCTQGTLPNSSDNKFCNIRFNPNLYICGKVCLSMLNTWSGPGWVPTNTITNVLVALQALVLNEQPLVNEPGFENQTLEVLNKYRNIIAYSNIKIGVIEMLKKQPKGFEIFKPTMERIFLKNIDWYKTNILFFNSEQYKKLDAGVYSMKVDTNAKKVEDELNELEVLLKMNNLGST
jgi:ubiquitin-protein ligase